MRDKYSPIPRELRTAFPPRYDPGIEGPFRKPGLPVGKILLVAVLVVLLTLGGILLYKMVTRTVAEIRHQVMVSEIEWRTTP